MTSVLQTPQLNGGGLGHEMHRDGCPPPDPDPPSTIGPRASVSLMEGTSLPTRPDALTLEPGTGQRSREPESTQDVCGFQWMALATQGSQPRDRKLHSSL